MNKKSTTKDELFLLKLYELASKLGSPEEEVDRFVIGRAIGQNDKGVNTIVKHLAQANFVKKGSGDALYLTAHGIRLVMQIAKER
ncbi:MAG: hypothetical protein ABSA17_03330 [Rhabdochlamydiaceae bacterium]